MKKRNASVMAAAMLLMLLTACQQEPAAANDLPSDTEDAAGKEHAAQATEYDLMVISDEYVDVELKTIYSDKIEFSVTSKLKNNEMDIDLSVIALDGLVSQERYSDTSFLTIKPQETATAYYNVDLTYTEHETLSMAASLFNDEGNGVKSYSVYEFPLGKEYHAEYEEPDEKLVYDSDSLTIRYAGAQEKGILLRVCNKLEEAIYFSVDMDFQVNGEDRSYGIGTVPIPAKSWRDRYIDIKATDMDYLPEEVRSFSCTGHTFPYGGGKRIEEFTVDSDTEAAPWEPAAKPQKEVQDTQAEITQQEQSKVYTAYKEALNIKFKDLKYDDLSGRYIYPPLGLPIVKDEIEAYESWGKDHGVTTLSADALYKSLVRRVETFYGGKDLLYANWKKGSAKFFFDFEPLDTWDEMKPYMDDISQYITEDKPLMGILKKFSSLQTVQGSFDFSGNTTAAVYGSYDFSIPDLSATAQEMGIKEQMLGYILAFIEVYGPETEITGMSYTCKLSF